jgi:hypothetical protein
MAPGSHGRAGSYQVISSARRAAQTAMFILPDRMEI